MKIRKKYLRNLRYLAENWSEWIDYLTITLHNDLIFAKYIELLDTDNSNECNIYGKEFIYSIRRWLHNRMNELYVSLAIDWISYTIARLLDYTWGKWWFIKCNHSLFLNWTLFRLIQMWKIQSLHDVLHDLFCDYDYWLVCSSRIWRVDYRIDFMFDEPKRMPKIESILNKRDTTSFTTYWLTAEAKEKYEIEKIKRLKDDIMKWKRIDFESIKIQNEWNYMSWWTIGKPKSKTSRVRLYDKLLDSVCKNKYWLYSDYFNYASVYRLELEWLDRFCKTKDWEDYCIYEIDNLIVKCREYFWLQASDTTSYFYKPNLDIANMDIRYISRHKNSWYNLQQNWISPLEIDVEWLLEKWVPQWLVEKMVKKTLIKLQEKMLQESAWEMDMGLVLDEILSEN